MTTQYTDRAIDRRDIRRMRRLEEIERIERIDMLADRMLNDPQYDGTPATDVWDLAAERVDDAERRKLLGLEGGARPPFAFGDGGA